MSDRTTDAQPPPTAQVTAPTDHITILTTLGTILATKRHTFDDAGAVTTESYGRAKNFHWRQEPVSSLKDIRRILHQLARRPQSFVIRGEPIKGVGAGDVVSRRNKTSKDGEAPHWQPADRHWIAFDFDEIEPGVFLSDPPTEEELKVVAAGARQTLPPEFHGSACVFKFSASTGVHGWDKVSLHLWFWLDRPVCDYSLRDWAKGKKIDGSIYKPVQPHYTADPVFVGSEDPLLGRRLGTLSGDLVTKAPDGWVNLDSYRAQLEAKVIIRPIPIVLPASATVHDIETARRQYASKALEHACEHIQAQGKGGRHDTAFNEAYAIGGYVGGGHLDRYTAESSLISAIQSVVSPGRHAKEADSVCEGIAIGVSQPRSLDHVGGPHLRAVPTPAPTEPSAPPKDAPQPEAGSRAAMGLPATEDDKMAIFCGGLVADRVVLVADVARGAPVDGHVVPKGFWLSGFGVGVWKVTPQGTKYPKIEHTPIVVTATDEDVETGAQRVRVAWQVHGRRTWATRWMPRQDALSKRGLERHIGSGFPVTSESAAAVVGYLQSYIAANAAKLPHLRTSSTMGWLGRDGADGFLCGRLHIVDGEVAGAAGHKVVDLETPSTWVAAHIAFRADDSDAGGSQVADAIKATGDWMVWRNAMKRLEAYPLAMVGVLASLSAPLIQITGCPNYVMDWAFRTSSGKTTIIQAAASVWGNPDEKKGGYIRSWSSTPTNIERTAVTLRSIPLILDDTAQAKYPDVVSGAIYDLAKGTSKPRGTKTGTEAVSFFGLPVLSTGEQPATSFGEKGGAKARCLEIAEPPFGGESTEAGVFVRALKLDLLHNYGHAGPRFVAWLIAHRSEWPAFRENYLDRVRALSAAATSGAASRTCETRALLELTFELWQRHAALNICDPIPHAWVGIASEVDDAAGEERALQRVGGWFASNQARFIDGRSANSSYPPAAGWLGVVVSPTGAPGYVGFTEAGLSKFLEDQGHNYRAIIKGWDSRGWLVKDPEGRRLTRSVKMDGVRVRVTAVLLSHLGEYDT